MFCLSCARTKTINLRPHSFNSPPTGIIHLVIPGLSEEQFLFLDEKTIKGATYIAIKNFTCFGSSWAHNLTKMRTNIATSLVSQMTGSAGSLNQCSEVSLVPIWDKLKPFAYKSVLLEVGGSVYSDALKCDKEFFKNTAVFTSKEGLTAKNTFHYQDKVEVSDGQRLSDKSCAKGECFSSLENNFFKIWDELKVSKNKYMMISDYTLMNHINKRDKEGFLKKVKEINLFINQVFSRIVNIEQNVLFLVSGTQSMNVSLGRSFSRKSLNLRRMQKSMTGPIWAYGPQAENFCGSYPEYEIYNRMFWQTQEFEIPFKDLLNL